MRTCAVGSLDAARAAVRDAAGARVILINPPGAVAYLGVGYFRALLDAVRREFPACDIAAILDCGSDAGWALAALRMGFEAVVLDGDPATRARVAAAARGIGSKLLARRPAEG